MENTIHYGFGIDYLSNWGLKEALREIYQNFLDYGDYTESVENIDDANLLVTMSNDWMPESLDFLRIGNSQKNNQDAIGKHGEGLKMAFMILLREGFSSHVITPKHTVWPRLYTDKEIGECFCLKYEEHNLEKKFSISFQCDRDVYFDFVSHIITPEDVIYDDRYWGQIVDKDQGEIYSGGLFVCKVDKVGKSYNIKPSHLPLDRDRSMPRSFDLNYAASKINQAHGKITAADLSYSDTDYIDELPLDLKQEIKPVIVGNSIEFTSKNVAGEDVIINNESAKAVLKKDNLFSAAIKSLKLFLAKQLGLYDLLIEFKSKHVHGVEAIQDFDLILERVNQS